MAYISLLSRNTPHMENQVQVTFYQVTKQDLDSWKADIMAGIGTLLANQNPIPAKDSLKLLTKKETGKILRISLPTVDKYSDLGFIKRLRVGRRILYSEEDILMCLKRVPDIRHKRSAELKVMLQADEK